MSHSTTVRTSPFYYVSLLLRIWQSPGSHFGQRLTVLTEDFCCFPQSLQPITSSKTTTAFFHIFSNSLLTLSLNDM
jgi:hypothetical protein